MPRRRRQVSTPRRRKTARRAETSNLQHRKTNVEYLVGSPDEDFQVLHKQWSESWLPCSTGNLETFVQPDAGPADGRKQERNTRGHGARPRPGGCAGGGVRVEAVGLEERLHVPRLLELLLQQFPLRVV